MKVQEVLAGRWIIRGYEEEGSFKVCSCSGFCCNHEAGVIPACHRHHIKAEFDGNDWRVECEENK